MNNYSLSRIHDFLRNDLIAWVEDNPRLRNKIDRHNLNYLFEFDLRKGLIIDLCRFEKDYYGAVFYPPEAKQEMISDFVGKVNLVVCKTLKRLGREELTLTITVKNKMSKVTHCNTLYIDTTYTPKSKLSFTRKLGDCP
jgi:hypothetical protein